MEEYKIDIKDYELIRKLMQTTTSIETLYKKLYDLEIRGLKNSQSYEKYLDYLKIALEVENKTYEDATLSTERCAAIFEFLLTDRVPDGFLSDTESIMSQNYNNRVTRRILGILIQKLFSDSEYSKSMVADEIMNKYMITDGSAFDPSLFDSVSASIEMQDALEVDMIRAYLKLLQEFVDSKYLSVYRDDLIKSKYNMVFINKRVENDLVNNKFNVPEILKLDSMLVAELAELDMEVYRLITNIFGVKESAGQISELIEVGDQEYRNSSKVIEAILRQCYMRSAFLFMSEDSISDINYEFYEFIEGDNYLQRHPNDHISEKIITSGFDSIKDDRKTTGILLSGRKND